MMHYTYEQLRAGLALIQAFAAWGSVVQTRCQLSFSRASITAAYKGCSPVLTACALKQNVAKNPVRPASLFFLVLGFVVF